MFKIGKTENLDCDLVNLIQSHKGTFEESQNSTFQNTPIVETNVSVRKNLIILERKETSFFPLELFKRITSSEKKAAKGK